MHKILSQSIDSGAVWRHMSVAPRDGTIIELMNTFGVAPWWDLFKYDNGRWRNVREPNKYVMETDHLTWRPYHGRIEDYVDPTNGQQNTRNYWLRAAGLPPVKNGDLPFDQEPSSELAHDYVAGDLKIKKPWWKRLLNL